MKNILVVEDEIGIQQVLNRLLSKMDCKLHSALRVAHALSLIKEKQFDFLLTDLKLPDGGGITVAREFRKTFPDSKIVVFTGSLTPEDRLKGAEDCKIACILHKPVDIEILVSTIRELLGLPKHED